MESVFQVELFKEQKQRDKNTVEGIRVRMTPWMGGRGVRAHGVGLQRVGQKWLRTLEEPKSVGRQNPSHTLTPHGCWLLLQLRARRCAGSSQVLQGPVPTSALCQPQSCTL